MAVNPSSDLASALPAREQLELFSETGQGAPQDMAKKSDKPKAEAAPKKSSSKGL